MDQLRKAMLWLKQHHFWVLSVLVAIIGVVCWKMAAARLSKEFLANRGKITTEFKNLETFRNKPFHPNESINEKQLLEIASQSKNVEAIWKTLYDRQSKVVLTWPEALSARFRDYVSKHKFDDDIPRDLRENYRDYIERHFESLPTKIGARVLAEGEAGGMGGDGGGRGFSRGMFRGDGPTSYRGDEGGAGTVVAPDDDYICEWLDQGRVREELNFPTTPSPIKIWVTQENLWVYHTLLDIIANTNNAAHADRISNAAVRTIYSLEVGRPAAIASMARGKVEIMQGPAAAGTGAEGELGMDGGDGRGSTSDGRSEFSGPADYLGERGGYSDGGSGGGMSPADERNMLITARYLDATGQPNGGGAAAPSPESADPTVPPPSAELPTGPFKRLPVLMTLQMDQRWLTHLISECASQPLPVEVTEVRISPFDASGAGTMDGEGGRYGGDGYGGGGGVRSSHQPRVNLSSGVLTFKQNPHLVTVVIQGIVTIFNEPDPSVLKVGSGEQVATTQ